MNNESPAPATLHELKRLTRSVACAVRGIRILIFTQANARWHLLATISVIATAAIVRLAHVEWIALWLCIGFVWSAEAFNTALEWLCDRIEPRQDERIRDIKDLAAGAVLLAAITAILVGAWIFLPRFFAW